MAKPATTITFIIRLCITEPMWSSSRRNLRPGDAEEKVRETMRSDFIGVNELYVRFAYTGVRRFCMSLKRELSVPSVL